MSRDLNRHWPLGFEFRNHNEIPDYTVWENTAFFLGPAVNYPFDAAQVIGLVDIRIRPASIESVLMKDCSTGRD